MNYPLRVPLAVAGAHGLAGFAIGAMPSKHRVDGKVEKKTTKQRLMTGLKTSIPMAAVGAMSGHNIVREARRMAGSGPRPSYVPKSSEMPDWLKGARTKAEARKRYHNASRSAHPDLGGAEDKMKQLNSQWSDWEGHFKKATINAFCEELEKIAAHKQAGIGAILGGVAGARFTPGGLKSKAIGAALGAGVGSLAGAAGKAAKGAFWDEPRAREHAELYGYVPRAAQQVADSPYQAERFV